MQDMSATELATLNASNTPRAAAHRYLDMGWPPIPIEPRDKKPLVNWKAYQDRPASHEEIDGWFDKWPDANVAIITGRASGIIVVDTDTPEGEAALVALLGPGFITPTTKTAKGRHRYFADPGEAIKNSVKKLLPGVDVRGEGGYVVAAPSLHETGHEYAWESERGPDVPLASLPPEILARLREESPAKGDAGEPARTTDRISLVTIENGLGEGERNGTITRYAGRLLNKGLAPDEALSLCQALNRQYCSPPLDEDEVRRIVTSVACREAERRPERVELRETDVGDQGSVCLADISPTETAWLWRNYIPLGKITLLDGDPGVGKSSVSLDLAARVSSGLPMPDESVGARGPVILIGGEDGLGDTVVPRLRTAGADLRAVHAMQAVPTADGKAMRPLRFPTDVEDVRAKIAKTGAVLVIIDPLMSFLEGNAWADHEVRPVLAQIARLAEDTSVAILLVRHLNKKVGADALYRGGGSIGVIGAARVGLLIGIDPRDASARVLAGVKNNLGPRSQSRRFRFESVPNEKVARIAWGEAVDITANDLVVTDRDARATKMGDARDFLLRELADGPVSSRVIESKAEANGISKRTLERARRDLRVRAERSGFASGSEWSVALPNDNPNEREPMAGNEGIHKHSAEHGSLTPNTASPADASPVQEGDDQEAIEERLAIMQYEASITDPAKRRTA